MNNKGFTIVEILSVIILLGLVIGIAVPGVMRAQTKAKEKTLATKVKNIEKAAILYGQDNREKFTKNCTVEEKEYYECMDTIKVSNLINCDHDNNPETESINYIETDDSSGNILNPTNETKTLNNCDIQIYKKYGKIYAVYLNKNSENDNDNTQCWTGK